MQTIKPKTFLLLGILFTVLATPPFAILTRGNEIETTQLSCRLGTRVEFIDPGAFTNANSKHATLGILKWKSAAMCPMWENACWINKADLRPALIGEARNYSALDTCSTIED